MDSDLRTLQRPLKDQYRRDPDSARITLLVRSRQRDAPVACTVEMAGVAHEAQAHRGVGGPGTAACSGDLLLGAVAACAQVTCQMVATAMRIPVEGIAIEVEGDLDLRGTLGLARDA